MATTTPASIEAACYYVTAEALTNVAKHADASEAHVEVTIDDEQVVLEIRDDGCGGAHSKPGHGILGLRDRVAALGGTLELASPPGAGTVVRATIPLGAASDGASDLQHREHAAVCRRRVAELELAEDVGDVLLDGRGRHVQRLADALVGEALRHLLEHVALAR